MANSNDDAQTQLADAMRETDDYYRERSIFQDQFGFGVKPAVVVVDFAYGWTDDAYAGGSKRLDDPVESTRLLLDVARPKNIPVIFTTSPWRPDSPDKPFKSAADLSPSFREWDKRACQIDERIAPQDRKSTRLNSSHVVNSYAVFCLKKKKTPYLSWSRMILPTADPPTHA